MLGALSNAATGLEAQQANVERISNDLANVNTDGYKRGRTEFQELYYETVQAPGAQLGAASQSPVGIQAGRGVKVGAQHKLFEQGPSKVTNHPYDFMIEGNGFFPVALPGNGGVGYTRVGNFHLDQEGRIVLASGARLIPEVTVPSNATSIMVSPQGEIKVTLPGNGEAVLGQIQLVTFQNLEGLDSSGKGLFKASIASGAPVQGVPGENGLGMVHQGVIEASNVNIANSMVEMITAQRAYEMGTKVMSIADQMLGSTANIRQ